jgi:Uma2 family endonuclease
MATTTDTIALPDIELVETDGEPLDSTWHRDAINLLVEVVRYHCRARKDFFVGGNMFIYFSLEQARNRDFRGPDFFYVNGVRYEPLRPYWVVWEEGGKYPDVIIELLSQSTAEEDRTSKKAVYERTFRTPEYFLYDPDTGKLEGWRLLGQSYQLLEPNEHGWLWSAELGLWLGTWSGAYQGCHATWLRFYDPDGRPVPLIAEAEHEEAEAARQRAEAARQRAEAARQRAETERQRAAAAEAEAARLKARLAELEQEPTRGDGNG